MGTTVTCLYCQAKISWRQHSTSGMLRHFRRLHTDHLIEGSSLKAKNSTEAKDKGANYKAVKVAIHNVVEPSVAKQYDLSKNKTNVKKKDLEKVSLNKRQLKKDIPKRQDKV